MKKLLILLLFTLCLCGCTSTDTHTLGNEYYIKDGDTYNRVKLIGKGVNCLLFYNDNTYYYARYCNWYEGDIIPAEKIQALT